MDKKILRKWLKAGFMQDQRLYPTDEGTPQGGIISPVLANLALDGLEKVLNDRYPKNTKHGKAAKVNFIRYADDFIITGSSQELLENEVKPMVEAFLKERGLELSQEKTHITHISEGFDFLGQNLRKYANGKLIIKPSKKNIKTFLEEVSTTINNHKQIPAGQLVLILNRKIRGWVNYHRHVASKRTFAKIDHEIFNILWRWAKRRHPNKGKRWIKQRYFMTVEGNNWIFYGEHIGNIRTLYQASSTPIIRHTKIRGEANPYDPEWEMYFEKRLTVKMRGNLRGRKQLLQLWKEQKGRCPVCKQPITELSGWHNHHIIWRVHGGTDNIENRILLHPTCHQQVHNQGLYVGKAASCKRALKRLEPYEGKLSRTVLRGLRGSNTSRLPDTQNIPEAKFASLILLHEQVTQPNYGGKSTTFILHVSDEQAMAQLHQHVTKLVKVPVFPEWTGYLWQAGQSAMLIRKTRGAGGLDIYSVDLDVDSWTRLITGGLSQGIIHLPQNT